jgi:hypothetical protein
MQEEEGAVDVSDDSASLLSIDLTDSITISNFCAIAVCRDSISAGRKLVGNLSGQNVSKGTVLVHNAQGFAVDLDHTRNRRSAMPSQHYSQYQKSSPGTYSS